MRSIQVKISVSVCALFVVAFGGLITYASLTSSGFIREEVERTLSTAVTLNAKLMEAKTSQHFLFLDSLAARRIIDDDTPWDQKVAAVQAEMKKMGYSRLFLVDTSGKARAFAPEPTLTDVSARDYFKQAIQGTPTFSDVIISSVTGEAVLVAATPVYRNGTIAGVLYGVLEQDQLQRISEEYSFGRTGASYIITKAGSLITSTNRQDIADQVNLLERAKSSPGQRGFYTLLKDRILKGETGVGSYEYEGRSRIAAFTTIPNQPWVLVTSIDPDEVLSNVSVATRDYVVIGIIVLVVAIVLTSLLSRSITRPIRNAAAMLKDISQGEGDLTRTMSVKGKDEMAELASNFNLTIAKVRSLVVSIKAQAESLAEVGAALSESMAETASSVNEIASNVASVKSQTMNQAAGVTETNSTMEQITVNIRRLNGYVEQQAANVTQSSSAVEQMLASIASVTQGLDRNAESVRGLRADSERSRDDLQAVSDRIKEIVYESDRLIEVSGLIGSIANQTNLLAMNAAIEAAHAGDLGRGFAVVADEVRKLAEESAEQSGTISKVLKAIKAAVDQVAVSAVSVLGQFEEIDHRIKGVSEREASILCAMEEQGAGSNEILKAIGNLNDITTKVRSGSDEMLTGSQEVIRESQNLERVTAEVSGSMNEMSVGLELIQSAVNRVNDMSAENKRSIDGLLREVARFKV